MTTRPYLKPAQAAQMADVTPRCVGIWCVRYPGLARKVAGRWRIDPDAFARLLRGESAGEGVRNESAI